MNAGLAAHRPRHPAPRAAGVSRAGARRYGPAAGRSVAGSVADIFDELDEDLRAERNRAMARRYGVLAAAAAVLLAAGIGGWQGWEWYRGRQAQAAAGPYLAAMRAADSLPIGPDPARLTDAEAFAKVAAAAPAGYRTLARLREAALRWDAGDPDAALALWEKVSADADADPLLRDLGALLWAQHAVDKGDPAAITARTAKLEAAGNAWRPLAIEVDAYLALRLDDKEKAARLLRGLTIDPAATDGLRERATNLLAMLGVSPAARG